MLATEIDPTFVSYIYHNPYKSYLNFFYPFLKRDAMIDIKLYKRLPIINKISKEVNEKGLNGKIEDTEKEVIIHDQPEDLCETTDPQDYYYFLIKVAEKCGLKLEKDLSAFEEYQDKKFKEIEAKATGIFNFGYVASNVKHNDIATVFKAFIGAVYNSTGLVGTNNFLKHYDLIKEDCRWAMKNRTTGAKDLYGQIIQNFRFLDFKKDINTSDYVNMISNCTGYNFQTKEILIIALTHKTMAKNKDGAIWDDYNLLEFLGDSVIKFFNSKRILKYKDQMLKNKDKGFSDIQRLKYIRTAAEKNTLFAYICMDTDIYTLIRHDTTNTESIKEYKRYMNSLDGDTDLENLDKYFVKMLADVIEAIIGAILLDSCSLRKTEDAWKTLFEKYLKKYADNPKTPPKRTFHNYCNSKEYLKVLKDTGVLDIENITKEQLLELYKFETSNNVMKYEYKYRGTVVFRRYYEGSIKSKEKLFFREIKEAFRKVLVPHFKKDIKPTSIYQEQKEMSNWDLEGTKRLEHEKSKNPVISHKYPSNPPLSSNDSNIENITNKAHKDSELSDDDDTEQVIRKFDDWLLNHFLPQKGTKEMLHDIDLKDL